jgi:hypothetical protein
MRIAGTPPAEKATARQDDAGPNMPKAKACWPWKVSTLCSSLIFIQRRESDDKLTTATRQSDKTSASCR